MDVSEFDQVGELFERFHAEFAPHFGRPETQARSEQ